MEKIKIIENGITLSNEELKMLKGGEETCASFTGKCTKFDESLCTIFKNK